MIVDMTIYKYISHMLCKTEKSEKRHFSGEPFKDSISLSFFKKFQFLNYCNFLKKLRYWKNYYACVAYDKLNINELQTDTSAHVF